MNTISDKKILLKDLLFNEKRVRQIAKEIQGVYPSFDAQNFVTKVVEKFPSLELSARVKWIRENLKTFLPEDYRTAVTILLDSLPPHQDTDDLDTDYGSYIYAPYSDFVATYGCRKNDLKFSLIALRAMTTRFSAEYAIRFFLNAFPKETVRELLIWSTDPDYHVRRLASEGTRPKLPWAPKITTDPEDALPILDKLFSDKSRFVTRSVANHLNDIAKIQPELVFARLKEWQASEKQTPKEMEYLIHHGLRTLIKQGDKDAMIFLQLSTDPQILLSHVQISTHPVTIGSALEFSFILTAQEKEEIIIDYLIHFRNKAGERKNKKVFKLKKLRMKKGHVIEIRKKHPLKQMTTRTLYPGEHLLTIQINGNIFAEKTFDLKR